MTTQVLTGILACYGAITVAVSIVTILDKTLSRSLKESWEKIGREGFSYADVLGTIILWPAILYIYYFRLKFDFKGFMTKKRFGTKRK